MLEEAIGRKQHKKKEIIMTIKKLIKSGKMVSEAGFIKRYSSVVVGFITKDGIEDETELDVTHSLLTKEGMDELSELFCSLTKELNTTNSSVTYLTIVSSSDYENSEENCYSGGKTNLVPDYRGMSYDEIQREMMALNID